MRSGEDPRRADDGAAARPAEQHGRGEPLVDGRRAGARFLRHRRPLGVRDGVRICNHQGDNFQQLEFHLLK